MLWIIAKKELVESFRSVKSAFMILVLLSLVPGLTWLSVRDYQTNVRIHEQMTNEFTERLRNISTYNELFSRSVLSASYAPDPLNIFARRTSGIVQVPITLKTIPSIYEARESANPKYFETIFSTLDPLWVFLLLVSLFGVVLGYDRMSGEKENRCLPIVILSTMSMRQIFWGKYTGLLLSLGFFLLLAMATSLGTVHLFIGDVFSFSDWIRIVLIYFFLLFYGSVFLTISILVSTLVYESAKSLATALLIWVCLIMVAPICANYVGKIIRPLPDRAQVRQMLVNVEEDYRANSNMELPHLRWMDRYNRSAIIYLPESLTFKVNRALPIEWIDQLAMIYKDFVKRHDKIAHFELSVILPFYEESMEGQVRYIQWLERASPFGAISHIGSAIFRADAGAYLQFINYCRSYREDMIDYLYDKMRTEPYRVISPWVKHQLPTEKEYLAKLSQVTGSSLHELLQMETQGTFNDVEALINGNNKVSAARKGLVPLFLDDLPDFNYQKESILNWAGRLATDLFVLVLFHLVVFTVVFVKINQYDPR